MRHRHDLPDAFEVIEELRADARLSEREVCIFLDYDGTLTPIVERPEDAVLDPAMRQRLERVAARFRTAVISGRGLDDLFARIGIENIFYAASHGFELRHPSGETTSREEAEAAADKLGALRQALDAELGAIAGIQLEPKRFGLAVHYRRAAPDAAPIVEQAVEKVSGSFPEYAIKTGKMVFEFVPDLDWDKGKALEWILGNTGLGPDTAYPLFLGDDVTDEDAFRAIDDWGCGIVVGLDGPQNTYACFILDDVDAVGRFLDELAKLS